MGCSTNFTRSALPLFLITQLAATAAEADPSPLKEALHRSGLREADCYLRGQRIFIPGVKPKVYSLPSQAFPYDWNFANGGLCGIAEVSPDIRGLTNTQGLLSFTTTGPKAAFSWGNMDLSKPRIRICYDPVYRYGSPVYAVRLVLRQSLASSTWTAALRERHGKKVNVSEPVTVTGTTEQTVLLPFKARLNPPFTALEIRTETPGNRVWIRSVEPCVREARPAFRKTLTLPASVRWAKCSITAERWFRLYVNGKLAVESPPFSTVSHGLYHTLYNYDLDASLFKPGKNVLAFEEPQPHDSFLLDGALLCADGTYVRFDTDETWRGTQDPASNWRQPEFDDTGWTQCQPYPKQPAIDMFKFWFNPSWKGRISVEPQDGRTQPIYSVSEPVTLRIAVPRRPDNRPHVTCTIYDEMGDGFEAFDSEVRAFDLALRPEDRDLVADISLPPGELEKNRAYAFVLELFDGEAAVERRRYEIAVCGPLDQPVIRNPASWEDGMDLKLVSVIDPADPPPEGGFLSIRGNGDVVPDGGLVTTPLGTFRRTTLQKNIGGDSSGLGFSLVSWKFHVDHLGRPHAIIADYPDDTDRIQELRISELDGAHRSRTIANDTVVCGVDHPLTHTLQHHHVLFFPSKDELTVSAVSIGRMRGGWSPERAARIGKIRIYEVLNDVPRPWVPETPGKTRWIAQQSEPGSRVIMQNCFAAPAAPFINKALLAADTPCFYRSWMVTYLNMIRRLRFSGENANVCGLYMYSGTQVPSDMSYITALGWSNGGSIRDWFGLMCKLYEENDMHAYGSFEFHALPPIKCSHTYDEVLAGADTPAQIDRTGSLLTYSPNYRKLAVPNWMHPDVRTALFNYLDEILSAYAPFPGFKGLNFNLFPPSWGPAWAVDTENSHGADYSDVTIARFEKETGISVPVKTTDPERFAKRYEYLMEHAREPWTQWRCDAMTGLYAEIARRVRKARQDLEVIVTIGNPEMAGDDDSPGPFHVQRLCGLDMQALRSIPNVRVVQTLRGNSQYVIWGRGRGLGTVRQRARSARYTTAYAGGANAAASLRFVWIEAQLSYVKSRKKLPWPWWGTHVESWPVPGGPFYPDMLVNQFVRANPAMFIWAFEDVALWNGREHGMRRFAAAFRALPRGDYRRLTGQGLDRNLWVGVSEQDPDVFGYLANTQPWTVTADLRLRPSVTLRDRLHDAEVRNRWSPELEPYSIRPFYAGAADRDALFAEAQTRVSEQGQTYLSDRIEELAGKTKSFRSELKALGSLEEAENAVDHCRELTAANRWSAAHDYLIASPMVKKLLRLTPEENAGALVHTVGAFPDTATVRDPHAFSKLDFVEVATHDRIFSKRERKTDWEKSMFWTGPEDVSAVVRSAYTSRGLLLRFSVKDDHVAPDPGDSLYRGDLIELLFDLDLYGDFGEPDYSGDDLAIRVAPPANGRNGPPRYSVKTHTHEHKDMPGIEGFWARTQAGYDMGIEIPWSVLQFETTPEAGTKFGFDIMIVDIDRGAYDERKLACWQSRFPTAIHDATQIRGRLVIGRRAAAADLSETTERTLEELLKADDIDKACALVYRAAATGDTSAEPAFRMLVRKAAGTAEQRTELLRCTEGWTRDTTLPGKLRSTVAVQRLRWLRKKGADNRVSAVREEAQRVLSNPEAAGYHREQAFLALAGAAGNRQQREEFLARALAAINFVHMHGISLQLGDLALQREAPSEALWYYLVYWLNATFADRDTDAVQEKISKTLEALGRPELGAPWQAWSKRAPTNRTPCPLAGLPSTPEVIEQLLMLDERESHDIYRNGVRLSGIGRFSEAQSKLLHYKLKLESYAGYHRKIAENAMLRVRNWSPCCTEGVLF